MVTKDRILNSLDSGYLVIWEEIARDGAQAKTLLSGEQRVHLARMMSALFGEFGPDHLIFAAGYPAIGREECEAICRVAGEVATCALATHGRMLPEDVDLGLRCMRGAAHGRVSFAVPISEEYSRIMMHQSARETLKGAIDLARYALDRSEDVPIDVALGGASGSDPGFLAEAALLLLQEGIATVKICDSIGRFYPLESQAMIGAILRAAPEAAARIGVHLHNDLGFSLINNLDAIRQGIRLVATSWLGLAERTGLTPTEQLVFVLTFPERSLNARTGISAPIWRRPPDLSRIAEIAHEVSGALDFPLRSTDPIISPAVNEVSTGAYFNDPEAFKPFDPDALLGIPRKLVLTHLANGKIVAKVAAEFGFRLDEAEVRKAMHWVKTYAYQHSISVIPPEAFKTYLEMRRNG